MNGTRSGGPQELIAIRAPGSRKPRTCAAALSASGSKMIPQRESAASKLPSENSREAASDSTNSTFASPAAPARSRPKAIISAEISVATTLPSGPAATAAVNVGSPYPAATSKTRSPGSTPASSTRRSLTPRAAPSISSDHLRQPVAALAHCRRCFARNSTGSTSLVSIITRLGSSLHRKPMRFSPARRDRRQANGIGDQRRIPVHTREGRVLETSPAHRLGAVRESAMWRETSSGSVNQTLATPA